jgi:hypothetical protein
MHSILISLMYLMGAGVLFVIGFMDFVYGHAEGDPWLPRNRLPIGRRVKRKW